MKQAALFEKSAQKLLVLVPAATSQATQTNVGARPPLTALTTSRQRLLHR
jgi:hypothetical protein